MKLPLSKYVWFDGKYVLTEKAQVPITTHAIHYGTSIFEGLRAYWNGRNLHIFRLDDHVKRFRRSGQFYNISLNFSEKVITDAIFGICKKKQDQGIMLHQTILFCRRLWNKSTCNGKGSNKRCNFYISFWRFV